MRRLFGAHRGMVLVAVAIAALACRRGEIVEGVSDSAFVGALAELQRIRANPALDSAGREDARRRALQARGLTAEQMDRAAAALADDPERARTLLQEVRVRLMPGAEGADSAVADTGRSESRAPDTSGDVAPASR